MDQDQGHAHAHAHAHAHNPVYCLLKLYLRAFIISINIGSILGLLYALYSYLSAPFDPHLIITSVFDGFVQGFVAGFCSLLGLMVIWRIYDAIVLVLSRTVFYAQIWRGVFHMLAGRLERWVREVRFRRV